MKGEAPKEKTLWMGQRDSGVPRSQAGKREMNGVSRGCSPPVNSLIDSKTGTLP